MNGVASRRRHVAIVGATLITLDRPGDLADHTVLVRDGTIADVGPAGRLALPEDTQVVDGSGCFCIPGLVDMHVHIGFAALRAGSPAGRERLAAEADGELGFYLANGVTTVRNMWGAPFHLDMAQRVAGGRLAGPRIRCVSPIIDGVPPVWPESAAVATAPEAAALAGECAAAGYEALKVYNHLSADAYAALAAAGARLGLPLVGHVPYAVGIGGALAAGQKSIEHFRGYDFDPANPPGTPGAGERFSRWLDLSDRALRDLAAATARAGSWNCPTLVTVDSAAAIADRGTAALPAHLSAFPPGFRERMAQDAAVPVLSEGAMRALAAGRPRQLRLLELLHEAGAGLLVGTDASLLAVLPGFSVHDELAAFVESGLTPREALVCCCRNPAAYYGEDDWGRLAPGCRADIVMLARDPLADIAATRAIRGVMAGGAWHEGGALERLAGRSTQRGSSDHARA